MINIDEKKERGREEEYYIPLATVFKFLNADNLAHVLLPLVKHALNQSSPDNLI